MVIRRTAGFRLIALFAIVCGRAGAQELSGAMPGDLVFRQGTEVISDAARAVDAGDFSHVGMLVGGPGRWQVVHATPAEVAGRADGVTIDSLEFYLDAARARRFAIYHVDATPAQRLRAQAHARARLGSPFRIADPNGTYCTVLVWQAWRDAGVDLRVSFKELAIPFLPGRYLLPSALQRSALLTPLRPMRRPN